VTAENYYVDAAVLGPSLGCVIAGDGMVFGETGGRQAVRRKCITHNQEPDEFGRTSG
jgi:hypothetical protein